MIGLAFLLPGLAQVPVSEVYPTTACLKKSDYPSKCSGPFVFPWFRLLDLADALEGQGVSYHPNGQHELLFPNANSIRFARRTNPQGVVDGYISANELLQQLELIGLALRLEGWRNPRLWMDQISVVLGTPEASTDAYGFYLWWLLRVAKLAFPSNPGNLTFYSGYDQRYALIPNQFYTSRVFKLGKPGEVFGLIAREAPGREARIFVDVAPVSADGRVQLYLPKNAKHWVASPKEFAVQKDGLMLVSLSGKAKTDQPEYHIVWPVP